jgi:hypothetical protein
MAASRRSTRFPAQCPLRDLSRWCRQCALAAEPDQSCSAEKNRRNPVWPCGPETASVEAGEVAEAVQQAALCSRRHDEGQQAGNAWREALLKMPKFCHTPGRRGRPPGHD